MIKYYLNRITNEKYYEDEIEDHILDELGLTIIPKGKNGELTTEQLGIKQAIVEWYLSDDTYIEYEENDDEGNIFELINEENEMEEM